MPGEWPRKIGNFWNTSDRYRFRREETAIKHQARVDDPDTDQGSHGPVVNEIVEAVEVAEEVVDQPVDFGEES
jgi:hypothetical protein